MATQYIDLVNRVLRDLNEAVLDSSRFSGDTGFYGAVKQYVNAAILDIYNYENTEWPFAWSSTTFLTTIGTNTYTKSATLITLDWDSFKILRGTATAASVTRTGTTATFTSSGNHNFITGDSVTITGANQSGYNVTTSIVVTGATTFTYTVDSATVTPATGTVTAKSNTVAETNLRFIDIDSYRYQRYNERDAESGVEGQNKPYFIVRKQDNNFILSPVPDRVYSVYYEGFTYPTALSAYNDVSIIPSRYDQVIVDKALHYAYMFRDNIEQAQLAQDRYEKAILKMRQNEIPLWQFVRYSD